MHFHYAVSIEVLTGCGYDTRTEILEEGFVEASTAEEARQQVALLGPQALERNWDRLADTLIGEMPTEDDVTVEVEPFDLDAECARTLRRIRAAQGLRDDASSRRFDNLSPFRAMRDTGTCVRCKCDASDEPAPDAHLEMEYEDRNGCGVEWDE